MHIPLFPVEQFKNANRRPSFRNLPGKDVIAFFTTTTEASLNEDAYENDKSLTFYRVGDPCPLLRSSFITETFKIFQSIQSIPINLFQDKKTPLILAASVNYLKAISTHLTKLTHSNDLSSEVDLFNSYKTAWGLCDLLIIRGASKCAHVLFGLLDWYKNSGVVTQAQIDDILDYHIPHLHPSYWSTIAKCACIDSEVYVNLLKKHPLSESTSSIIHRLIELVPLQKESKHFKREFMEWQNKIQFLSVNDYPASSLSKDIINLIQLLKGSSDAISYWFENDWIGQCLMTAVVTNPTLLSSELPDLISSFEPIIPDTPFDLLLKSIFKSDIHATIKLTSRMDAWFATHLTDLLLHSNILGDDANMSTTANQLGVSVSNEKTLTTSIILRQIRDFFIANYAELLQGQGDLLNALYYFNYLESPVGKGYIQNVIFHMAFESAKDVQSVFQFCKANGYFKLISYIYTLLGQRALSKMNWADSLTNYYIAQSPTTITSLCHHILEQYFMGKLPIGDLLEICTKITSDSTKALSYEYREPRKVPLVQSSTFPPIQCLTRFTQYKYLLKDGKIKEAGEVLGLLVSAKLLPKKYWPMVLRDAVQLCKRRDSVLGLDTQETFEMMRCLEEVGMDQEGDELLYFESGKKQKFCGLAESVRKEFLEEVRLALIKNLAASYIL